MRPDTIVDGVRAFARGLLVAVSAPLLLLMLYLALLATTLPFAAWLGQHLSAELSRSHPQGDTPDGIDAEWWLEYRRHATGLAATFTPNVIGFAAPLENLSAAVDATPRPWILVLPITVFGVVSAWMWGGILERFRRGRRIGVREFAARSRANFGRVLAVNLLAVAAVVLMYVAVHPLLFGYLLTSLPALASGDTGAVALRVMFYALFGGALLGISTVADYARIQVVLGSASSARAAYASALHLMRRRWRAVAALLLLASIAFLALLAVYGFADLQGGSRTGGWRAVAIAQGFILGRLGLRLVHAAGQVEVATPAAA